LRGHEAPGFAVMFVVAAAVSAVGIKEQDFLFDLVDRDDVPGIDGHEIGDEDVNLRGGIHRSLGVAAACMQMWWWHPDLTCTHQRRWPESRMKS
jgi:hypothetical protein